MENMNATVSEALSKAGMEPKDVDAVAVTVGPGLEICLRVGCDVAKSIAVSHGLPFVGVHHLEAHILMARLGSADLDFPFLALLVSGGHCQLLQCEDIGSYKVIGGTLDDSLGEAYDKVARMLNLPVGGGGGPAVEKLALQVRARDQFSSVRNGDMKTHYFFFNFTLLVPGRPHHGEAAHPDAAPQGLRLLLCWPQKRLPHGHYEDEGAEVARI